ncbi:MAG: DUF3313 domain-containing protein [Methylomonas sp.]
MSAPFPLSNRPGKARLTYPLLGLGLLMLSACSTTQKAPIDMTSGVNCGLLGKDCGSRLTPGGKDQIGLRYINPAAQWTSYKQIMISPVTFWGGDTTQVSAADQQTLVNYFNEQLHEQLGKQFTIVQQPGPGVMKIDVAMTDAETATPVLRSISMIVPQAHMLSNLKYLATGTFPFVGGAQAEMRITDSVTGKVLAEGLDKRIGGGAFRTGFQWQWGDAENAINTWSEMAAKRLAAWTSGAERP